MSVYTYVEVRPNRLPLLGRPEDDSLEGVDCLEGVECFFKTGATEKEKNASF